MLTNRHVRNLRKAFENNLLGNKKLSKSQISKIIQFDGFLATLFVPLIKVALS